MPTNCLTLFSPRPTRCIVLLGPLLMPCGQVWASRKLSYGTRIGTDATIVGSSGLGTDHAVVRVKRTRADVRVFCLEYAHDRSAKCIVDALRDPKLQDSVKGDCKTGQFVDLFGHKLHFTGLNKPSDDHFAAKYAIFDQDGVLLGGSATSGYFNDLEAFMALCPNRGIVEDKEP